jgi:hypothetical protein
MAKPRLFGSKSTYIPNARADMRFNKKLYHRGLGYTDKHETVMQKIRESRLARQKGEQNVHS